MNRLLFKNIKKKSLPVLAFALLFMFTIHLTNVKAAEKAEEKELKVLVIEINPNLKSKGMKVTDYLNTLGSQFSLDTSIQSLKDDFAIGSNGVVKCNIVGIEYLNEFPKYTQQFTLSHLDASGKRIVTGKDYQLDESTYLDLFGKGWYGWWNTSNPVIAEGIDKYPFKYDYNYLIEKFDLVRRRNENEFDMVWVFSIDPVSMGETNMIGRSPIFVNGNTITADCDNFVMGGFTLSRVDSAFECVGHMAEAMLNHVYDTLWDYNDKLTFSSYNELSTWQKFYLCKFGTTSDASFYGVGKVHFAPNSRWDYEWDNNSPVLSTWIDWKNNYPNLTGETAEFTSSLYLDKSISANEAHKRWWFSMMPHYTGRDNDGYSHNWWDYILANDCLSEIKTYEEFYTKDALKEYQDVILLEKGETLSKLKFNLSYYTEKTKDFVLDADYNFVSLSNPSVISINNGKITALANGTADITLKYDGREASYQVMVVDNKSDYLIDYFENVTVAASKDVIYNGTASNTAAMNVAVPEEYTYKITYKSSKPEVASISSKGKITAKGKGKTTITTTISTNGKVTKYTTTITVKDPSLKVSTTTNSLKVGKSFTFKATKLGLKEAVTWTVSNTNIATVDAKTGKLTAKKTGTVYVIASAGNLTAKFKVSLVK